MIALIKLIIVLVLSVFSMEETEEKLTLQFHHNQEQFQYQKMDMLIRCKKTCVPC